MKRLDAMNRDLERIADSLERMVRLFERVERNVTRLVSTPKRVLKGRWL